MMYSPYKGTFYVSQAYKGPGRESPHRGIDLVGMGDKSLYLPPNLPECTVYSVGWENPLIHSQGYGYHVWVRFAQGDYTVFLVFGHLASAAVKKGQVLRPGALIGVEGSTGRSDFSHCHLELRLAHTGVWAENMHPASFFGLPNVYNGKTLVSDWPEPDPAPAPMKEVKASGIAYGKDEKLAGSYCVNTTALNLRNGAGTAQKILTSFSLGSRVRCYGYFTDYLGVRWLYVVGTKGSTRYTGFMSARYLKKLQGGDKNE